MKRLLLAGLLLVASLSSGCADLFGGCGPHGGGVRLAAGADGNVSQSTFDLAVSILEENGYGIVDRTSYWPHISASRGNFSFRLQTNDVASEPRLFVELERRASFVEFSKMDEARAYALSFEAEAREEFGTIWSALTPTGWRIVDEPVAEPSIAQC